MEIMYQCPDFFRQFFSKIKAKRKGLKGIEVKNWTPVVSVEKPGSFALDLSCVCEVSLSKLSLSPRDLSTFPHVIFTQFYASPIFIKALVLRYFSHTIKFTCL